MDIERLGQSPAGRLIPIQGQDVRHGPFAYFAFMPNELSDDVPLASPSWTAIARAANALGKLDQACTQLPDPKLLIRPALYREALDTSALEGTVAPLVDLLEAQLLGAAHLSPEAREIHAYVRVATEAFDVVRDRPLSISMLAQFQAELFQYSRQQPRGLGSVREEQVWIGPKHRPIYEARFVPPPGDDRLKSQLEAWERWVSETDSQRLHPVLQAALAHYQFETLHPFGDGNGRLGRLVVVLQLLRNGTIRQPAITLSPWLLKHRTEYQDNLLRVSCTGDFDPWIQFFCEAICQQAESLIQGATNLRDWLEESRQTLHDKRWAGKIHLLLQDLIEWPLTTIAETARRYGTSVGNATKMVDHLVEAGIMQELTGKSYGRVFGSTAVMNIVDSI
ncbi:Fic family protein [Pedococcus sp. 5OH_020]|uniref:Fic family protein n=1 Tax=Pedococcus sp. 5OH_020 TaxID=2989814 RepID=UPI0022E9E39B|nr:Fic/DOC family N-terminal domain-containing protein [Pedococcus sp. 5OH_020]